MTTSEHSSSSLMLHKLRELAFRAVVLERDHFELDAEFDKHRDELCVMLRAASDAVVALAQEFDKFHDSPVSTRRHELGDMCLIAALEMRTARNDLLGNRHRKVDADMLAQCRRACGVLINAATSVEDLACRSLSKRPELSSLREVESSLQVRRIYAFFRLSLHRLGPVDEANAYDHLIFATEALDELLNSSAAIRLRLDDRTRLEEAYARAVPIVMVGPAEANVTMVHMAQDLTGLSNLLMSVNDRVVLVEHDRDQLRVLLDEGSRNAPPQSPRFSKWLAALQRLLGRDVELDKILVMGACVDRPTLDDIIERLANDVGFYDVATAPTVTSPIVTSPKHAITAPRTRSDD